MKSLKGTITIFLALVFVSVSALILTLAESARTAGLRYHLQAAADASIDSLFSEYNNGFWDRYRITAYECGDISDAENSMVRYMDPYINVKSWFRMNEVSVKENTTSYLTDTGGEWLEQEVLDYMNYGLAEDLFDVSSADDLDKLWSDLKEADAMEEITSDYAEKSKEALELEQTLMDINKSLSKQNEIKAKAVSDLYSGSGGSFQRNANRLISEMERVAGEDGEGGLVCVYENGSYELEEELDQIDEKHRDQYEKITSDEGKEILQSVKNDFLGYSSDEKGRRQEVEEIYSRTVENILAVQRSKEAADMIEELEAELDDEEGDYEDEISDLWDELAETFSSISIPDMDFDFGVANEEEKGFLQSAKALLGGDLLTLILPEGKTASTAHIDLSSVPSVTSKDEDRTTENRSVIENVLIAEYIARFFSEFTDDSGGIVKYEMEYICAGKDNERENLASAGGDVFAVREGMNYLSIMRDGNKRSQARHLAEEIVIGTTGGTLTALVPVVECLIIGIWSGAESVIDCRALLKGNKVSLVKQPSEWKLDVSEIISWGKNHSLGGEDSGDEKGIDYENYLKFIILLLFSADRNYRAMDLMQLNLRQEEGNFLMKNCVYGTDMEVTAKVSHLFTSVPMISAETAGLIRDFEIKTDAVKAY